MVKARIHKHAGALRLASDQMEEARNMDLADRYLNTKSTRYLLRANLQEDASKTIALFTKDGENGSNLFDMQCVWYERGGRVLPAAGRLRPRAQALAASRSTLPTVRRRRRAAPTLALVHFTPRAPPPLPLPTAPPRRAAVVEDQFDFHTYCIRKMTLRAYVRMWLEDRLYGHAFVKAACGIIETYLKIYDNPEPRPSRRRRATRCRRPSGRRRRASGGRRRRRRRPTRSEGGGGRAGEQGRQGEEGREEKPVDEDPDGVALATVENPLEKASTYLRTLQTRRASEACTRSRSSWACARSATCSPSARC